MSFKQVNLDGGEFGFAESITALVEFPILVKHIHEILNSLPNNNGSVPSYCFKFGYLTPSKTLESIIYELERIYPEAKFYECDGRKVFDMRGASGGLTMARVCYLIKKT